MLLRRFADVARSVLPAPAFSLVRRVGTATLTPFKFSSETGHFRSSLRAAPVDADGSALPWYTYPMIDFLQAKNFTGRKILEFGSGYSTLWWASHAERVVSFEGNHGWFTKLQPLVPPNVALEYSASEKPTLEDITKYESKYDVIIIDGLHRYHCAEVSMGLLAPNGAFIIDNSEGYGLTEFESITTLFRDDYNRVDFYGYCPGNSTRHCSSLLFREKSFLVTGDDPPRRMT